MSMTQTEYAAHIGKTKQYVNKLVRLGKIPVGPDNRIDPTAADAALRGAADPARRLNDPAAPAPEGDDSPPPPGNAVATVTFDKVRTEREGYQAALTKIELDRQRGLLVEKAGVERQAFEAARLLRDRLLALVPQIAGELASMTDERDIAVLLRDRIKSVLMETSQDVRLGGADLPE